MIRLEEPPSNLGQVVPYLRRLVQDLRDALDQVPAPNTLLQQGSRGTSRTALGGGDGVGASFPIADQWDSFLSYGYGDLAYCFRDAEMDDGFQAGLYQCILDIPGSTGNTAPAVDTAHWRCICNLHYEKFTMVHSGGQKMVFDVGRAGGDPKITIHRLGTSDTENCVKLNIADIPSGAGSTELKIRELTICENGTERKQLFVCSESYAPPS